jgi:Tfp pilus assembly protein PilF
MADQLEARVEQRAGNAPAALAALDRAVQRAPSNVGLRLERARLVSSMGRPRQARLDVDAALRLDPKNAEALRLATELDRPPSP